MSGTETHANSVNVAPDPPQEAPMSGEGYSNPIYRQPSPHGKDVAIIKAQIDEDMHDLEIFTARVEAKDVKISKQTQILLELKAELHVLNKMHQETTRQLLIERDVKNPFESLSQELGSPINSAMCAPGLMKIHSSNTDDALSLVKSTMESLNRAQEQFLASIYELQGRLRIESTCLCLLSDRKRSLEIICDGFRSSWKRKILMLSSKRLPTEILMQIFDLAVEEFIEEKTIDSRSVGGHPTLNIALVCQHWHDIVMNTARLWRYIPIASSSKPLWPQRLGEYANQSKGLFLDLTGWAGAGSVEMGWDNALGSIARSWENMEGHIPTILSMNYRRSPISLNIPFKKIHTYSLYNIYPIFLPSETTHVTSLFLHFRFQPSLPVLVSLLRDLQNLTNLEVLFPGELTPTQPARHASRPSLKHLAVPLSMVGLFFSGDKSISTVIQSLTLRAGMPSYSASSFAKRWHFTVESSGLATGLQYLALDGGHSLSSTEEVLVPLLWGLKSVVTLVLCGPFFGSILDELSKDPTLLPSLQRLEMRATDIDQTIIDGFLDSRREPREATPTPVPIRELVLDHCRLITRDFCDHVGSKVETLVVYC